VITSGDWKANSLRDLATINYGKSPAGILAEDGDYPVVGTGGVERSGNDYLYDGDSIILGRKGTIDRVYYVTGKFWTIDTAYFLSNFQNTLPIWLFYFLETQDLRQLNEATGVPSLSRDLLYKISVPTPSQPEQVKIAEILSTVDRAIEQTEALIAKQQRIKTGLMQDLLTRGIDEHGNLRSEETHEFKDSPLGRIPVEWEISPIEEKLSQIIDYRGRTPTKVEAGVHLLTAKNVRDGYLEEEPYEFISEAAYDKWMTRGIPDVGDVLFTTEAPMGNVARVPGWRIALAQRLLTLCPRRDDLSQDYLFWLLHWRRTTERLELLTSGSTVIGVKQSVFRKVLFPFPKKDEQFRIVRILDSHNDLAMYEKTQLAKLRRNKTALMQDLLTGKKRVTRLLELEGQTAQTP
jgi:type I restriction enzyme, S subunit